MNPDPYWIAAAVALAAYILTAAVISLLMGAPPPRMRRTLIVGAVFCVVFMAVAPAFAHSWYSGSCCNDKDCAPIPATTVTRTADGYRVRLQPGDHPLLTRPVDQVIPYSETLPSEDSEFHACIYLWKLTDLSQHDLIRCLYVPEGDVGA